ncbi:MAG: hypothetical protein HYV68_02685 [Candidatus Taylorbacteria bacterium]|nr:hypothetical protein [Candidatus Taylorbacteria bacterium]
MNKTKLSLIVPNDFLAVVLRVLSKHQCETVRVAKAVDSNSWFFIHTLVPAKREVKKISRWVRALVALHPDYKELKTPVVEVES